MEMKEMIGPKIIKMGNEEKVNYFVCSVKGGAHCDKDGEGNQKLKVTVSNNCPTEGKSFISLTPVILSSRYSVMPTSCHWEMAIFSCLINVKEFQDTYSRLYQRCRLSRTSANL